MSDITCVFGTRYSIADGVLTLDEPGKAKEGSAPSVFDLAAEVGLKEVVVVDSAIDGFIQGYKSSLKANVKLCYGVKLCVCADATVKDEASTKTESKVIVFIKNTQGYHDLIRILNRAATEQFYYERRTDYATLKELWTDNLILALPFFSSFISVNTLTFNRVVPDFPVKPVIFREVGSELPFAHLIDKALDTYIEEAKIDIDNIVKTKTVLYRERKDFLAYMNLRCIGERTQFEKPNINHLSSDAFCLQSYKELTQSR